MRLDYETLKAMAAEAGIPSPPKEEHPDMKTTTSGAPLSHAPFSRAPQHIPNENGDVVKTELVEERSPERTIKRNWWWLPDRLGKRKKPHSHPWAFDSTVEYGWIKEERYTPNGDGTYTKRTLTHKAGETYFMDSNEFHVVIAVGYGTVTRMVCGEANPGNEWGYLDPETWEYTRAEADPDFMRRLWEVNPHLAKDFVIETAGNAADEFTTDPSVKPLTLSEAISQAQSIAGVRVRVVRMSTGEVAWPSPSDTQA
jgi:hypothetical protein